MDVFVMLWNFLKTTVRRHWAIASLLLVATVAYAGVIVHGQLIDASLENLSSDPTAHTGRVYFNTATGQAKIHNGTAWTSMGGSGNGEKNYLSNGANSNTGWTASGAGVTATTDTTPADLPDPTALSALKVTGVSGSTAFAYASFTLDPADFNKKMKLAFDQACGLSGAAAAIANCAASDFRVDVCSCSVAWSGGACNGGTVAQGCGTNATRLPLSTDSSSVSALPALTGTYRTTWDSPGSSQQYIQVQIGLNASVTHAVTLANIVAGPGIVTQGAALGSWQSWTPSGTWITNTSYTGLRRRNGTGYDMQVKIAVSGAPDSTTLILNTPSDCTIDTAQLVHTTGNDGGFTLGQGTVKVAAYSSTPVSGTIQYRTSGTVLPRWYNASGTGNKVIGSNVDQATPATFASGDYVEYTWWQPCAELAGSGTVNVVQNDCEYAFNTDSTTSSNTTSANAGYGPGGVVTPSGSISTGNIVKRVFWQRPRGVNDQVTLEMSSDGVNFYPMMAQDNNNGMQPFQIQNGTAYGITSQFNSATTTYSDVMLGKYMYASSTYGAAGTNWDGLRYWRLKKCAGGQAVGFGAANTTAAGLVSYEDSGTFTANFTGARTISNVPITYSRVGKTVTLRWTQNVNSTCVNSGLSSGATDIPSGLRPAFTPLMPTSVQNNGSIDESGELQVGSGGQMIFYAHGQNGFTNAANCGFYAGAVTYPVN